MNWRRIVTRTLASAAGLVTRIMVRAGDFATPMETTLERIDAPEEVYRSFHLASSGFDARLKDQPYWLIFDVMRFATAANTSIPTAK